MSSLPTDLLVAKLPWWLGYHVVVLYAVFASLAPFLRRGQFAWPLAALGCLGLAWYHIYSFIYDDFIETSDGDVEHYLNNSDIFVNAYRAVTSDKFGWGWSWQLLAWTCTVCFRIWEAISARQEREAGSTKSSEGEAKVDEAMELPTPLQSVWLIVAGFFGAMSTCGFFLFGRISEKSSCESLSSRVAKLSI